MDFSNKDKLLEELNEWKKNSLCELLDITFSDVTEHSLSATMPVTPKVHQPCGLLHGGASVVLAETLGSVLSSLHIDKTKFFPVGTNLTTNHLKSKKDGTLIGTATFIRKGKTLHVSQIEIRDENGDLINYTTMTNSILPQR